MTFESDLFTLLKTVTPSVWTPIAPAGVERPYVTWQHIGGPVLALLDGSDPRVRFPEIQINVWASTKTEALSIAEGIRTAMHGATAFFARPQSDPVDDYNDPNTPLYGVRQDYQCRRIL